MAFRLRRKKDVPGGLWSKCPACAKMIYNEDLEKNLSVCPDCGHHHTVSGRRRIDLTADPGTFEEHYADILPSDRLGFIDAIPYAEKLAAAQRKTGNADACLVGTGKVLGQSVVIAALDFSFMGGSMGEVVGEKIARAVELAGQRSLPVLIFSASGGARMHEGAISLMQMAKTCAALHRYREQGGYSISVLTHPTTGGVTASFASVCDLAVAEPGALIGFAGPRVIQNTIRQDLPEGFQRSEFLLQKGHLDLIVPRAQMREKLALLIGYGSRRPAAKRA